MNQVIMDAIKRALDSLSDGGTGTNKTVSPNF